ncbi:MAG: 5'/3'-nucleotidase SurE [Myxococcota bacterium]
MTTPLLLLTNDDGVSAPGLRALAEAVHGLADVVVVAPDTERSGASHSMTFHSMLRAQEVEPGRWAVSGTPVDCVYFGLLHVCERPPAIVLSGINHGFNLGTDVFYSGTLAAAAEARLRGFHGVAVSLERGVDPRWSRRCVRGLVEALLDDPPPEPLLLNINVAHRDGEERAAPENIDAWSREQGVMVTRLGRRSYVDSVDCRTDPLGRPYYWIGGPPGVLRGRPGDDTWAVGQGMASVTPLRMDLTDPDPSAAQALLKRATGLRGVDPSTYDADAESSAQER